MPELIDKQAFLAGCICLTQGWRVHHAPHEAPGPGLAWRFHAGTDIARSARRWLGAGLSLPRTPREAALEATGQALADSSVNLVFEATFVWGGLVARADAVRRSGSGWTVIEVKSGTSSKDGKLKEDYLDDIAYTVTVAQGAGLEVAGASLVVINRDYRLNGDAEVLVELDVTGEVLERAGVFAGAAQEIAAALSAGVMPEPELIFACGKCDFFSTECIGAGIPDPLFAIPRLSEPRFAELRPYERVSRIPAGIKLTDTQQHVVDTIRARQPSVRTEGLSLLDQIAWPVRYLDFEAVMPHLPWFANRPPYDATPFQYSLHTVAQPGDTAEHVAYLAPAEGDWRRALTEQLLAHLGDSGSIVVYSSYEKTRLKALAELLPDLAGPLGHVVERLFDLERVFAQGYVHPDFGGRTSIKKVLPVMVPELTYDDLPVNNGDDAAGVFGLMRVGEYPTETHPAHRERLLAYCKLDTLAMLR